MPGTFVSNVGCDRRNVDAALSGTEHQADRVDRARRFARAVADAVRRAHQMRFAANHAEYLVGRVLRARVNARFAADASQMVDDGMQRRRRGQTRFDGFVVNCCVQPVLAGAAQRHHQTR